MLDEQEETPGDVPEGAVDASVLAADPGPPERHGANTAGPKAVAEERARQAAESASSAAAADADSALGRGMDPVFTIVGALFVMLGVAAIFDIGGTAGHMAQANVQGRDTLRRRRTRRLRPGTVFPETSRGMRWWGVLAAALGAICVLLGLGLA